MKVLKQVIYSAHVCVSGLLFIDNIDKFGECMDNKYLSQNGNQKNSSYIMCYTCHLNVIDANTNHTFYTYMYQGLSTC